MSQVVAVTGATGFIGRALLDALLENKWKIRALTRKFSSVERENLEWVHGDLDNYKSLQRLVTGAYAVIHCAGAVRGSSLESFLHNNVVGTDNLLRAVIEQNSTPRFLFISSLAARESKLSWYAASKFKAEQLINNYLDNIPCTIFRPAAVYGPGDKELRPLFKATYYGVLPSIGDLTNRFGMLHVNDLVAAIHYWLSIDKPIRGTFEIDDGTPGGYSYRLVAAIAQDILGRPVRCIRLPESMLQLIANANLWISRLLGYSPMLTPGKICELQHPDWVCDIAPLKRALVGWYPNYRLCDTLPQLIKL
ncbi:NAD(P)-dependent oxidoreductase [Nitrosomonas sp. Nm33]|uniref:NAD-dependent epimerase/dehydratase family protein n=1 Tax=Nitrosomonas sp. Nm33 TaxID=133724 RepID=UPI000895B54A|nr:NAD(P)-dependent oxidoreductase [Nitrosomonas sp. Nm33]SDY15250.1 Nucleoside-diphosphate-sugar epimerase [Nitrosomonas sp. Nm33]